MTYGGGVQMLRSHNLAHSSTNRYTHTYFLYICHFGFESRRGHGCLSLVSVVCCQVEVSATS